MERTTILLILFIVVLSPWAITSPTAIVAPPGRPSSCTSRSIAKSNAKYAEMIFNPKELKDSRVKLFAGSADGYPGYVDGRPREARLNHPKGFVVDEKGNMYVAYTTNMAIRKIGETGVTTIAGGRSTKLGHIDGHNEEAKFSNDFYVVYVSSTCSLLVVDRGNQVIREIQLNYDDCAYQYDNNFSFGLHLSF